MLCNLHVRCAVRVDFLIFSVVLKGEHYPDFAGILYWERENWVGWPNFITVFTYFKYKSVFLLFIYQCNKHKAPSELNWIIKYNISMQSKLCNRFRLYRFIISNRVLYFFVMVQINLNLKRMRLLFTFNMKVRRYTHSYIRDLFRFNYMCPC